MPPRYLLSTASLYFQSVRQSFQLAGEAGFDGLELSLTPASARSDPRHLHALAREQDLLLASVHPPTVPLPGWGRSSTALKRLALLARAFPDCQIIVLHAPAGRDENDPQMVRFYHTLETLQEELAGSSVAIALENRNRRQGEPLALLDHPEALLSFSRRQHCPIVLDTAHADTLPLPLLETYTILRPHLVNIHLSNVTPARWWDRFSYPRSILSHHRPPEQGTLPLRDLMAQLARDRYDGLITLELSPVALRCWRRSAIRRILHQSLTTCRQWMRQDYSG